MSSDESLPCPVPGIFFSFVQANGIQHRLASTVRDLDSGGAFLAKAKGYPLVFFLHGFPESWYSWRHQLVCPQDRPFLAVAPDMRGYGSTFQPKSTEEYTQPVLARDVMEVANTLGYERFIVVGHDWGAMLAWNVALLYPRNVIGIFAMSVPYAGTPKMGMLSMLEKAHGKCLDLTLARDIRETARFHYMLHHCLPHCEDEYAKNAAEFLYRIYGYRKGCRVQPGTPEYDIHGLMFPPTGNAEYDRTRPLDATTLPGFWTRLPRPLDLPNWFTPYDLDYITKEFQRSGFLGAISWYRAADRNLELMKELLKPENGGHGDKVLPPAMFLTGVDDAMVRFYGGKDKVKARLKENVPSLVGEPIFIPDCGHWIQQEAVEQVNNSLLDFLSQVTGSSLQTRRSRL